MNFLRHLSEQIGIMQSHRRFAGGVLLKSLLLHLFLGVAHGAPGDLLRVIRENSAALLSIKTLSLLNWGDGSYDEWTTHVLVAGEDRSVKHFIYTPPTVDTNTSNQAPALPNFSFIKTYVGHTGAVVGVDVTDEVLWSCAEDQTIREWSARTGRAGRTYNSGAGRVWGVAVPSNITAFPFVFSGAETGEIAKWSLKSDQKMQVFSGHTSAVRMMIWHNNSLFSVGYDSRVIQWRPENGAILNTYIHTDKVRCIDAMDQFIFTGGDDNRVRQFDFSIGVQVRLFVTPSKVISVAAHNGRVFAGSGNNVIEFEISTGNQVRVYSGHSMLIYALKIVDGYLLSGSEDMTLMVWQTDFPQANYTRKTSHQTRSSSTKIPSSSATTTTQTTSVDLITTLVSSIRPRSTIRSTTGDENDENNAGPGQIAQQMAMMKISSQVLVYWGSANALLLLLAGVGAYTYVRRNRELTQLMEQNIAGVGATVPSTTVSPSFTTAPY